MTDPRDARALLGLIARVVGTAGAGATLVGCCEVVSLGWSSWRGPSLNHKTVVADRGLVASLERDDDGWIDAGDCEAICGENNDGCTPTEMVLEPRQPRLLCHIDSGRGTPTEGIHKLPRDLPLAGAQDGAAMPMALCEAHCDNEHVVRCELMHLGPLPPDRQHVLCRSVTPGGCHSSLPAGRFPHTHAPCLREVADLGALYAAAAEDEAAAITAFRILARELREHGAPEALVKAARAAAADEARHARAMRRLAERHGGQVRAPRLGAPETRSLQELAIENAAEGLAGETVGALLAMHQAMHARDPEARRAMAEVARDEAEHAALAWRIHAFCAERLTTEQLARVEEAFVARWQALRRARFGDAALLADAGLPEPSRLAAMMG